MQKGCPKCGRMVNSNVRKCPYCNYNFDEIDSFFKKISDEKYNEDEKYAGFIKRLVAGLFDCFVILVLTYFILILIDKYLTKITLENLYIGLIIYIPLYILYNSICERTPWRGSLGKYILNIEVTDEYENPVTFPKALLRNLSKILNVITLGIGFVISVLPPQKQALNDKVSHTYVINKLIMQEDTKLSYANPLKRLVAFVLDTFIIGLVCYGLLALVSLIDTSTFTPEIANTINCAKYILCLVVILFYFPFSESRSGSTIGKNMMKIKLVKLNGRVPGFITCFARELILFLDIITLGFLLPFVNPKRQTFKDILTRTAIIDR